ncbi:flagellar motor control protein ZomB [Williamsia sterculiae]|uniref:Arabinofuranosyltransferase n=1 Tax=Williamsia sterculiae TaxID=1344003 RepID=A0A1N7H8I6_9NOCA|nr:flagellar motor control protein ZomB [Williamsia sterculiae]SIS21177.1 arabinofuranosyltransferase [Williamsia sterculiae]
MSSTEETFSEESPRGTTQDASDRSPGRAVGATARLSFTISAIVVAALFATGAWQRRWIADDGLIVLRTVRNLLAGNGPVFNKGERVESNTSTVWTYLVWFWSWVTDGRLEFVVLWIALTLSVTALPIAMYGTLRMLGRGVGLRGATLVLPVGALVYIALPPARDFATSGLEVSLCIFWVSVLWVQFVGWSRRTPGEFGRGTIAATLALGFTAGLSPLIRPELTVVGAVVLVLVFLAPMGWRTRVGFVLVAAVVPVAYQIFRMGYYGLLVPNTAVAKDASGSKWGQGLKYLTNLFGPYLLLLPVIVALVAGLLTWVLRRQRRDRAADTAPDPDRSRVARFRDGLQRPGVVAVAMVVCGLIEGAYWLRQGGDFMHARVLLVPLYLLLLPVMVVPVVVPAIRRERSAPQLAGAAAMLALFVTTAVWALLTAQSPGMTNGTDIGRSGIVDERRFYIHNLGVTHPITAEDYLNYPRVRPMVELIDEHRDVGGVLLPSANYDEWYYDPLPSPPPPGVAKQMTVYFLNLGMTSMNAPLDTRVIDQVGLAFPLAAHTERLEDGRIGHDKALPQEWVVAATTARDRHPFLPRRLSEDWVAQARTALECKDTRDLVASYAAPMNLSRFRRNLVQAMTFTNYRIDDVPYYELQRCKLPDPTGSGALPTR